MEAVLKITARDEQSARELAEIGQTVTMAASKLEAWASQPQQVDLTPLMETLAAIEERLPPPHASPAAWNPVWWLRRSREDAEGLAREHRLVAESGGVETPADRSSDGDDGADGGRDNGGGEWAWLLDVGDAPETGLGLGRPVVAEPPPDVVVSGAGKEQERQRRNHHRPRRNRSQQRGPGRT